jgi:excisionase family DNA binding protein
MSVPTTDQMQLKLLLSRGESAHALGIGTTTLDDLIARGSLPARRIGRRVLVHADDLASYANTARESEPRDGSV